MAKFFKFLLYTLLYCNSSVFGRIGKIVQTADVSVADATANILRICYADRKTLVMKAPFDELLRRLLTLQPTPVIILDELVVNHTAIEHFKEPILFFTTLNSDEQLQNSLRVWKSSPWWHINVPLFIVDKSNGNCENAWSILQTTWQINVVTAFFLCLNIRGELMIYSYNPYTNRASHSWKKADEMKLSNGWTLFYRVYREDTLKMCEGLYFDRTKHLDGSKIKIVVYTANSTPIQSIKKYNETFNVMMYLHDWRIIKATERSLNATLDLHFLPDTALGWTGPLGNASVDLAISITDSFSIGNFPFSYPIGYSGFTVVTQPQGFHTPFEKVWNNYGFITLVSIIIIVIVTFGVILTQNGPAFASFEILRLLINTSLYSKFDTVPRRIFFASIFIYFFVIQSLLSGDILSLLMKVTQRSNAKDLEDLKDSKYQTVYAAAHSTFFFDNSLFQDKLVISGSSYQEQSPNRSCFFNVLKNQSVACIDTFNVQYLAALKYNLYVMKKYFGACPYGYPSRHDWPLKQRFDIVLMMLHQSGLSERWSLDSVVDRYEKRVREMEASREQHLAVSLTTLSFVFKLFGLGLACAFVCFLLEQVSVIKFMNCTNPICIIRK